jgi:hypothetical protein
MGDVTSPVHEHTYLSTRLMGKAGEVPCELLRHEALRRERTLAQTFELADLAGLQALRVAEDRDGA